MILLTRNPEFNRNFWTEFSAQRAIAVPVLLGLLLWLLFAVSDMPPTGPVIENTMLAIAGMSFWLGGPYQVSQGLFVEWERHTWDIQRLSPITPWTLVWGKLFGSTLFVWYIGAWALLVYLVLPGWCADHSPLAERLLLCGLWIALAVMLQAGTFLSTLYSLRFGAIYARYVKRPSWALAAFAVLGLPPMIRLFARADTVNWYGSEFAPRNFLLVCSSVMALWGLYGAYRITRSDFLYRNGPMSWLLFSAFIAVLVAGFSESAPLYSALAASLLMLYVTLFSAPVDTLGLHHSMVFLRNGQWRRLGETLPLWTNGLPVVLALLLYAMLVVPQGNLPSTAVPSSLVGQLLTPMFYLSLSGFLLRDILLLHALSFTQNNQRALGACVVYLGVLYALVPGLIKALDGDRLLEFFLPLPGNSMPLVWMEVFVLALWARQRWDRYTAQVFVAQD